MARRRLRPTIGLRLIFRSIGKLVHAMAAISLVFCALAAIGLVALVGKSIRMTRRPRQLARGLAGRLSASKFSPD